MSTEPSRPGPEATSDVVYVSSASVVPVAEEKPADAPPAMPPWPRMRTPIILFVLTCLSTFFVGSSHWLLGSPDHRGADVFSGPLNPADYDPVLVTGLQTRLWLYEIRSWLVENSRTGATYAAALIGILLAHEFGHFLVARWYRIPASLPYFIPMPFSPIGTMGAVIAMDGRRANRKEMFDIGLAGPLGGLVVILPILALSIGGLQLVPRDSVAHPLDMPLLVRLWLSLTRPDYRAEMVIALDTVNPLFMAGWVGCVLTGLNMMPLGQLDGGHVTYALFGRGAHWLARGIMLFVLVMCTVYRQYYGQWVVMIALVLLIGIHHPPTSDDKVPLGGWRWAIGLASLALPILTFAPRMFF